MAGADPSVEQRSTYTLLTGVLYLADTASHGAEISSRAGKANQSPASPPAFPPTFLPTASLKPCLTPIPRWPQLLQARGRSLSGCLHGLGQRPGVHWEGTSTALILLCCSGKGSKAPRDMAGSWDQHQDVNPSTGMPGSLFFLGCPEGIPLSLSAPVPAHQQPGREQGQALTAFAKRGLCPWPGPCAECHTDIQLPPRNSLLLCTFLVPLGDPVPKSCPNPRSHSIIVP